MESYIATPEAPPLLGASLMLVPVSFVGSETVPIVDVIDVVTVGDSLMPTAVSDHRLPGLYFIARSVRRSRREVV